MSSRELGRIVSTWRGKTSIHAFPAVLDWRRVLVASCEVINGGLRGLKGPS